MTEHEVIKKALKKLEACKELCHDSLGIHEFKVVKNILIKQIPKKPKENLYYHDELCAGKCICGGVVYKGNCVYCPSCGQKLDWREEWLSRY